MKQIKPSIFLTLLVQLFIFTSSIQAADRCETSSEAINAVYLQNEEFLQSLLNCSPVATGGAFVGLVQACDGSWPKPKDNPCLGVTLHLDQLCYSIAVKRFGEKYKIICNGENFSIGQIDGISVGLINVGRITSF